MIDIRNSYDLSYIASFPTQMSQLRSFLKTSGYYLFGCEKGILILDFSFNEVTRIRIGNLIYNMAEVKKDIVLLGDWKGTLQVLDLKKMRIILTRHHM